MSSEETPDLPVTAYLQEWEDTAGYDHRKAYEYEEDKPEKVRGEMFKLVKEIDAQEAIKEARQAERQKILDKIEEMFTAWRKRTDRLENQEDYNGDKELELNKGKAVKNALKELEEEVDQS